MVHRYWTQFSHFVGWPHAGYRSNEQLVASIGGMISILLVLLVTGGLLGRDSALLIVPSLGASAVLVFAVPHSPLTQPWAVLGGHLVSAVIGVSCYKLIPAPMLAAAFAVGLAIAGMHLARCIHPPGGATALTAVVGGSTVHSLGYTYALAPVAINCLIILIVGFLFNFAFPWRRYPASLMYYALPIKRPNHGPVISEAHIEAAMDRLNVVIDINPGELGQIIEQALQISRESAARLGPAVLLGHSYCNDRPGPEWSIRQIVDERPSDNPEFDLVIYKIQEGAGKGRSGSYTRREFAEWIGSELSPGKGSA
jgi:CBS-domain-containing membrane protein